MELIENTDIIKRIIEGEVNLYIHIVRQYERMIYTIINRILHNNEESEDLAQEIFIKVYQQLDRYNYKSKFSTWLYRIAYNETIDYIRKQKRYINIDKIDYNLCDDEICDEIQDIETEELLTYLEQLLHIMPQDDAFIITLFYLKNLSIADIAEVTNQSVSNIKVRMHRIRQYMHIELKKMMNNEA